MNDVYFLEAHRHRLGQLAQRAIDRGLTPADFVVVCIDVDSDPTWRDLATTLMPTQDWQQYRDRGERPYARGTVMRDGLACFVEATVAAATVNAAMRSTPRPGTCHAVAFVGTTVSVFEIAPVADPL